jgi:hypothetical protein
MGQGSNKAMGKSSIFSGSGSKQGLSKKLGVAFYGEQDMSYPGGVPGPGKVTGSDEPTKEKLASDAKTKANPEFSVDSPLPAGTSDIGGEIVGKAGKVFASYDQHLPNSNIKTGVTNTTAGKNKTRTKLHGAGTDERNALITSLSNLSTNTKKEGEKILSESSLKDTKDIKFHTSNPQMSFKPGGANKYKK